MAGDRLLEAAHPLERYPPVAPALKKRWPHCERAIVGFDGFRPPVQHHEEIGAIEARQRRFGAAGLLERGAEEIVSARVPGRELDGLTQEIDGFCETLKLDL